MRRLSLVGGLTLALLILSLAPSGASAALFPQCPAVEADTGCQFLFTVTDAETTIATDPSQPPYENIEDALIGVVNNSSKAISSIPIAAENELFGFELDGICTVPKPAPGCKVLPKDTEGNALVNAGEACPPATNNCGFVPEGGEPPGQKFPEGVSPVGELENGDPVSGYEGPRTWYSGISPLGASLTGRGVVNFSPPLQPGESTYFSLESPPAGGFGTATALTTTLAGGGQAGPSISVVQGTPVTDTATLGGANAATATGTVAFNVYADPACKTLVAAAGTAKLAGGKAGPSAAVATLAPGTYYWQAAYGGNTENQAVASACGTEVLTVQAPTTTTTTQSGGGVKGASITVPVGTSVTDSATVSGPLAAASTGTVSFVLYKDKACTVPAAPGSAALENKGLAGPSAAVKPAAGTYYWRAAYSGSGLNAPSVSACGSEVLVVAKKLPLGLKGIKGGCQSKRHIIVHPKAPHSVHLVKVEEFINGKHIFTAGLTRRHTAVDLRGFPKGTYKVELIAKDSKGKTYEDTRTFHTCVRGKHHKKKKK